MYVYGSFVRRERCAGVSVETGFGLGDELASVS
jgi:hypothetical protein